MPGHAIEIADLAFHWPGHAVPCLDIPRLVVAAGERLFLHGPSGSGKSTLLNLIGGVLRPDCGRLRVVGHDLPALAPHARDRWRADHLGFIFQQFNLLPWMSALDNVTLPCTFSPRRAAEATRNAPLDGEAGRLLTRLGLPESHWRQPARRLSVGQQQRVAAARALLGRPELIVADEPTSALDAELQQAFIDLLLQETAASGSALVFVSHDRRLAAHFDRCIGA